MCSSNRASSSAMVCAAASKYSGCSVKQVGFVAQAKEALDLQRHDRKTNQAIRRTEILARIVIPAIVNHYKQQKPIH